MTGLIDFARPVAVLFVAVLHGIPDQADPAGIVRAFAGPHGIRQLPDPLPPDQRGPPTGLVAQKEEIFARSNAPVCYRSRAEILRMFSGFDLVEPGLTAVTRWHGDGLTVSLDAAGQWWLGGVGRRE